LRSVTYDFNELDELMLSYAATVHKSQGCEYPVVIIPIHTQHYTLLQRNLLYTAITRGRKLVVLVGARKAIAIAVNRIDSRRRVTLLKERLRRPQDVCHSTTSSSARPGVSPSLNTP
jgi:exodeoxyribonuclease V alpha subunit